MTIITKNPSKISLFFLILFLCISYKTHAYSTFSQKEDELQKLNDFKSVADDGDVSAMISLAKLYSDPQSQEMTTIKPNISLSYRYSYEALNALKHTPIDENGDIEYNLGAAYMTIYNNDLYLIKNHMQNKIIGPHNDHQLYNKALALLQKSADKGNESAQTALDDIARQSDLSKIAASPKININSSNKHHKNKR